MSHRHLRAAWAAIVAAALVPAIATPAFADGTLYTITSSNTGPLSIYTIDTTTAAATKVTTIVNSGGHTQPWIEFIGQTAYVNGPYDTTLPYTNKRFGTVDLTTGIFTPVDPYPSIPFAATVYDRGSAVDQSLGRIYYSNHEDVGFLQKITPPAAGEGIGELTGPWPTAFAFDDDNNILYGVNGQKLVTVNTATGDSTDIGWLFGELVSKQTVGLAFNNETNELFTIVRTGTFEAPSSELYSVNITTGAATLIGEILDGSTRVSAIAASEAAFLYDTPIPEPASLSILSLAAASLLLRRRR